MKKLLICMASFFGMSLCLATPLYSGSYEQPLNDFEEVNLLSQRAPILAYLDRGPIVFNAIEKSASVFIAEKLRVGLNMPLYTITAPNAAPMNYGYIIPQKLNELVAVRGFVREHLFPTEANICLLQEKQQKMIFHVRDLRQRVVSFAYYYFRLVSEGHPEVISFYEQQGCNVKAWGLSDFIEYFILEIPDIVQRIQGWLEVYHQKTIPILITTYEEFLDDEVKFFEKVLTFYGIPHDCFQWVDVAKDNAHNFRSGKRDEWKTFLTLEQQQRVNEMIPEELFEFFYWERTEGVNR